MKTIEPFIVFKDGKRVPCVLIDGNKVKLPWSDNLFDLHPLSKIPAETMTESGEVIKGYLGHLKP